MILEAQIKFLINCNRLELATQLFIECMNMVIGYKERESEIFEALMRFWTGYKENHWRNLE